VQSELKGEVVGRIDSLNHVGNYHLFHSLDLRRLNRVLQIFSWLVKNIQRAALLAVGVKS